MNTPVEPPTQARQWTAADVRAARDAGRPDLISAAFDAGQLANLIHTPGELGQPASPATSRQSTPMTPAEAVAFVEAQSKEN